jgi:hypothetical protein
MSWRPDFPVAIIGDERRSSSTRHRASQLRNEAVTQNWWRAPISDRQRTIKGELAPEGGAYSGPMEAHIGGDRERQRGYDERPRKWMKQH